MKLPSRISCCVVLALCVPGIVGAGSSPHRVAVIVNDASRESQELGQYYQEQRGLPESHLIHVVTTTNSGVSRAQFESEIYGPITNYLAEAGLTGQLDSLVFTPGMPYRVADGSDVNGITSVVFYDFQNYENSPQCTLPGSAESDYFAAEQSYRDAAPAGARYLSTMLTAESLEEAKALVDRSVLADGLAPTGTVYYLHSTDLSRNVRWPQFEGADFSRRLVSGQAGEILDANVLIGESDLVGYMIGKSSVQWLNSLDWVPGALADHLTSFGGRLYDSTQMSILSWIGSGASGSYGTVVEPCNYTNKFPAVQVHTWYARGFTLAESYWMSLHSPYMGVVVGDPLCAPYAIPPSVAIGGVTNLQAVSGTVPLAFTATASSPERPVDRIDLFLDDRFLATVTNVPYRAGDTVSVEVDGRTRTHSILLEQDVVEITEAVAGKVNGGGRPIAARAVASGDRVELIQKALGVEGTSVVYSASVSSPAPTSLWVHAVGNTFLESVYPARKRLTVVGDVTPGDEVELIVTRRDGIKATNTVVAVAGDDGRDLLIRLRDQVGADPLLNGVGGCALRYDRQITGGVLPTGEVFAVARDLGWDTYNIEVDFTVTPALTGTLIGPDVHGVLDSNSDVMSGRGMVAIAHGYPVLNGSHVLDTSGLADGPHPLRAVAHEGTAARVEGSEAVTIIVDNHGLECSVDVPGEGEAFLYGQDIRLRAAAGEGIGAVTSVTFRVEGRAAATISSPPYEAVVSTTNIGIGRVTIQAHAESDAGESTLSDPVEVLILNPDDVDGDGLPDGWEELHFTNTTYTTGAIDSDGDGQDNRTEFVADTNPNDPADLFVLTTLVRDGTNVVFQAPTRSTRRYGMQANPVDLANPTFWTPQPPVWLPGRPGQTTWTNSAFGPFNFLRLSAEAP